MKYRTRIAKEPEMLVKVEDMNGSIGVVVLTPPGGPGMDVSQRIGIIRGDGVLELCPLVRERAESLGLAVENGYIKLVIPAR